MNIKNDCRGCHLSLSYCSLIKFGMDYLCECKTCLVKVMCDTICQKFILVYHKAIDKITTKEK
jgi:hypothetical protein